MSRHIINHVMRTSSRCKIRVCANISISIISNIRLLIKPAFFFNEEEAEGLVAAIAFNLGIDCEVLKLLIFVGVDFRRWGRYYSLLFCIRITVLLCIGIYTFQAIFLLSLIFFILVITILSMVTLSLPTIPHLPTLLPTAAPTYHQKLKLY